MIESVQLWYNDRSGGSIVEIVKGRFLEGENVTVKIDGIEVTRKVKYNRADGLYIIYKNRKYFEYEL